VSFDFRGFQKKKRKGARKCTGATNIDKPAYPAMPLDSSLNSAGYLCNCTSLKRMRDKCSLISLLVYWHRFSFFVIGKVPFKI
jgi:hypothetical protein